MILLKLLQYWTKNFLRKIYWLLKFTKIKKGKNLQLEFPIKIGGSTKISIGNNCKISKNVYFGHGEGSKIIIGNNCKIEENVQLVCSKNSKIIIGDNCWIMKNTIIRTASLIELGDDVAIATNCAIFSREEGHQGMLKIGKGTHIGDGTIIDLTDNITIENEVAIGPNCVIYSHDHDYNTPEKAAWKGGVVKHPVHIKDGAWVGANVTILPQIVIGTKTVIAAGSVVTKSIENNCIYAGVPAKKIKNI